MQNTRLLGIVCTCFRTTLHHLPHCLACWTHLKTIGAGTQNLMRIFLMLSWRVFSSKYQEVWSLAEAPAVGSGAPHTWNADHTSRNTHETVIINGYTHYLNPSYPDFCYHNFSVLFHSQKPYKFTTPLCVYPACYISALGILWDLF